MLSRGSQAKLVSRREEGPALRSSCEPGWEDQGSGDMRYAALRVAQVRSLRSRALKASPIGRGALRLAILPAALFCIAAAEPAPPPDQPLPPAQEARAERLFQEIRCVVCQHESIADSPAGLAADMRRLVREQIASGRTDRQVREDLIRRYGDFVLFRPPFRVGTALLWLGPFLLVLIAAGFLWRGARRRRAEAAALTPQEEARLALLLSRDTNGHDADATSPNTER